MTDHEDDGLKPETFIPVQSPDGRGQIRTLGFEVDGPRFSVHTDIQGFQYLGMVLVLAGSLVANYPLAAADLLVKKSIILTNPYTGETPDDDKQAKELMADQLPNLLRFITASVEGVNETMTDLAVELFADQVEGYSDERDGA